MISAFLNEQPELIDEFTKRYPGIAIYIMDILSRSEAIQVTRKLSIDGIIRMIQEEAKVTILNKFSFMEDISPEIALNITSLVEKVGKEKSYLTDEERELIYEIYRDFEKGKKKKFKFFDALPTEGRLSISVYLLNNDLVSSMVFILLTPKDIRFSILDSLPKNDLKKALSLLPQNVLLEYATYSNLPIQEIAEHIEDTALKDTLYRYKPKKDKIIEIGAGTGSIARMLNDKGYDLSIGEIHPNGIEYALKNNDKNLSIYQFNIMNNPFKNHFDVVGLFDVLEHIEDDQLAIKNISKMLRGG